MATHAATDVPANIDSDTTWATSESPYVVSADTTIAEGATLTIEPGVVVEVAPSTSITIAGTLVAQGTGAAPVTFTNISDSADNASWNQLIIAAGAIATLSHADLRYGGAPQSGGGGDLVMPLDGLIENHGTLSLTDSTIEHTSFSGGLASDGTLTFSRSSAHDLHTKTALMLKGGAATIAHSSFGVRETIFAMNASVTLSGMTITDPVVLWNSDVHDGGDNTEPTLLDWESLASDTTFLAPPFVNVPDSDVDVNAGATLTIAPGAIVKAYAPIHVFGTLVVGAVGGATTTLTSAADDTVAGDTNHAEEAKAGVSQYDPAQPLEVFVGIVAEPGSTVSVTHTLLRYAGDPYGGYLLNPCAASYDAPQDACAGAILNQGGTVSVADSTFEHATYNDLMQTAGTTTITGSRFATSTRFAYLTGGSLTAHGNSIARAETGVQNDGTTDADATSNWWGSASGPHNADTNPEGTGPEISAHVLFSPWLTNDPFAPPPAPKYDNVLFLPGIEGSRLYEGTGCGKKEEEKLWDPIDSGLSGLWSILTGEGDDNMSELALDASGNSACSDIYTKESAVIDTVGGSNLYKSLLDELDGLKHDGTINDWKPVAYDWRLSLDDLLANGTQHGDRIYYEESTSTPYIEQTLRQLAATSQTGKVTIIAHSNGGLVTKALLDKLGDADAAKLVDKVILVASPQSGTPSALASLLVGFDAGIYKAGIPIISNAAARTFAHNSPMTYHLLPSEYYIESTMADAAHPLVQFEGKAYKKEEAAYGSTIANRTALDDFLLANDGGREDPDDDDLSTADIANPDLIDYANRTHGSLDFWTPPAGIQVSEIAGWGIDTVAGIRFYTQAPTDVLSAFRSSGTYEPIIVEDGDGTVAVPSALQIASSTNVRRYWVDLHSYNKESHAATRHADLFEIPQLRDFISNLLRNKTGAAVPNHIYASQPAALVESKKLTFFLHSPLTLQLTDASGNTTGLATDGSMTENIPDSSYGQFGEVKYVTVPQGSAYTLTMHGQTDGSFTLSMQERSGDTVTSETSIADVPTTDTTLAQLTITDGVDTASALTVDEEGDGKNIITIMPKTGETVPYAPPAPEETKPEAQAAPVSGSLPVSVGGAPLTPNPLPQPIEARQVASSTATTTLPESVATTSTARKDAATLTRANQPKKKLAVKTPTQKPYKPTLSMHAQAQTVRDEAYAPSTFEPASVASVVSKQSFFKRAGETVYNGLHKLWTTLLNLF